MLKGKTVLLGVTGGIAAYKAAALASALVKQHAAVEVVMTRNATQFITPLTFEQLTGRKVMVDTFDRNFVHQVEHISLAQRTDLVIIAPATANVCAKLAHGLADDMLTTTVLACRCPKLIAPAMNTNMYENPVVQQNMELLRERGVCFAAPVSGHLACGDTGSGKLADPADIVRVIEDALTPKDLSGLSVLVTAGPTREAMDPVRFLSNHSTGKMGYAIAERARARGARVTLISGPVALTPPEGVEVVPITSALDMYDAVLSRLPRLDWVIKAAAVGDYRPATCADDKLKKKQDDMSVALVRNPDILKEIGARKNDHQTVCGFSMETRYLINNSRAKLEGKNCDMLVANNLRTAGAGFAHDTNVATLLYRDGSAESLDLMAKDSLADIVLDRMLAIHQKKDR